MGFDDLFDLGHKRQHEHEWGHHGDHGHRHHDDEEREHEFWDRDREHPDHEYRDRGFAPYGHGHHHGGSFELEHLLPRLLAHKRLLVVAAAAALVLLVVLALVAVPLIGHLLQYLNGGGLKQILGGSGG